MAAPIALEQDREEQLEAFYGQAQDIIGRFCELGVEFTFEDVRERMTVEPPHPNNWGSITSQSYFKKIAEDSGRTVRARRRSANSRRLVVWKPVTSAVV